jgi:hypothetical protein
VLAARARIWARDRSGLDAAIAAVDAVPIRGRTVDASRRSLLAGALALAGDPGAVAAYAAAADAWRALDLPIHLAMCLAEGHRLAGADVLAEADAVLDGVGATGLAGALHALQALAPPVA